VSAAVAFRIKNRGLISRKRMSKHSAQAGQALTEFLVAAVAIIPLFLLMPLIAKYQDINHSTLSASRYAAFEAMTRNDSTSYGWKPPSQLADEVRRRFFSNPDAPIKTDDVAGNFKANQNLFWRGPRDEALISDINNDVQVSFGTSGASDHASGFSGAPDGNIFSLKDQLDLKARGIYTAGVSVSLLNMPAGLKFYEPFDQINLRMTRRTSLAIDAWTASGPGQVASKIEGASLIYPATVLSGITPILGAAVASVELPGVFARKPMPSPRFGELDFFVDVVPADRLRRRRE
jgi:hypothetical protein